MQRKKEKISIKKVILVLCVLTAACCGIFLFLHHWESGQTQTQGGESNVKVDVSGRLKTIEVNGTAYQEKGDIRCYVIMGIDHMDNEQAMERGDLGQNDLNLVLVVNDTDETYQILQINRDTMTDVIHISNKGTEEGTSYQQIALAHSYGDGKEISCENVVNTISRFLWNQSFDGYVAIDMEAVNVLADGVGGVPVQVNDDFSAIDPSLVQGETVNLTSANALTFVRTRKGVGDETNVSRQTRQQEFIDSFIRKASSLGKQQLEDLYTSIESLRTSNLSNSSVTNLMYKMTSYQQLPMLNIEGTNSVNEKTGLYEFKVKNSSLQNVILSLFYNQK